MPDGLTYSEYLLSYGTTEPIVSQDIARNIRVRKLTEQLTSKIEEPDDAILQAAYSRNRDSLKAEVLQARHIVVKTRAEAEAARARVTGDMPEDFAEVAAEVSTGTTAQRGGALKEFPRGFLIPRSTRLHLRSSRVKSATLSRPLPGSMSSSSRQ